MSAPARPDQLDPATLASLGHLELVARWIVDGFLTGLHRSARKGFSSEFAEHRPYLPGDDLRYVDWRIVARSDRWVVKEFEEETNLRAVVLMDTSRSMAWSGSPQRLTKLQYANRLAAAMSLMLLRQRDAVALVRFSDVVAQVLPPRARMAHWRRLLAAMSDEGAGAGSAVALALAAAATLVRRPGLVVLCSDLLVDPGPVEGAVRTLRAIGHEVVVLHLLDPAERDLSLAGGEAIYVDPESDDAVPVRIADVRDAYVETSKEAIGEWRTLLGRAGARYTQIDTDVPFGQALRHIVAARERMP
jgi:uncharacterized protein (DUF58 family)